MTTPYLPSPVTWTPQEIVTAPQLRADVSGTVQLVSAPPLFVGSQTAAAQTISGQTITGVQLDTETADTLNGHQVATSNTQYFAMFPGWYLAEGAVSLNYTGGAGSFSAGITANQNGSVSSIMGMRLPNTSPFLTGCMAARLVKMVNTGFGGSNDYIQLAAYQTATTSGGTEPLTNGTSRFPVLTARWVCALAGSTVASVPSNDAWPVTAAGTEQSTTLLSGVSAAATSIRPASLTGMTFYGGVGGAIGLDPGTTIAETVTITGVPSGGSVPVTATTFAHATGAVVTVPVSAAFMNKNVRDQLNFLLYPPVMQTQFFGPAFSQVLASQVGLPGVGTAISLLTPTVDNYGAWNGTNVWTAPFPGVYYAHGQLAIATGSTSTALAAGLTVTSANYNSGTPITLWGGAVTAVTSDPNASFPISAAVVTRRLRLNAGDTVGLAGYQNDSGANSVFVFGLGGWNCRLITLWQGL